MNKKIFLISVLSGVLVAGIVIFIYRSFSLKTQEGDIAKEDVAVLNTRLIPFISALKLGVYKMEGYSSSFSLQPDYVGEAVINRSGPVYTFEWRLPDGIQRGIGILESNILSVGFVDAVRGDIMGVVSYRIVGEDKLEGKIASSYVNSVFSSLFGPSEPMKEVLTWQSELPAATATFQPFQEQSACGPYSDEVVTGSLTGGPVWGSQPYTDDSDFNRAAVHTGLITPGQTATIKKTSVGYLYDFPGSTANGVTTDSWATGWCGVTISLAE